MTKNKVKKYNIAPANNLLPFIEIGVLLILTILKSYYFYRFIGAQDYSVAMALTTTSVLLAVFTFFAFFRRISIIVPIVTLYSIMCILMFADRLFASYFNGALPRIVSLTLLVQATGVGDSVTALFSISHFLYITDLLFIYVYLFFRKRIAVYMQYDIRNLYRYALSCVCALLCGTLITSCCSVQQNGGYFGALKNELFTYHARDLINTVFPDRSGADVNPFDYIGKTNYKSAYQGIGNGKNLINIQVEALNEYPIGLIYNGQEITPNLNKLLGNNTIYFDNYYWCNIGGGGTSDAEFMVHNSLYPPSNESAYIKYSENDYYGLPHLLKDNGFTGAYVFHGYKNKEFWNRSETYPGQGFDRYINGTDDFENTETIGLGISDEQFFRQSVEYMVTFEQPFYAFLITLTSHHPYEMPPEYCMLTLMEEHRDTMFGDYLQSMRYADEQLGLFLELLKENGLYDNSVITIYGDHYGLSFNNDGGFTSDVIGKEYTKEEIYKIPLFIHIPNSGINETVSTAGSHIDYTPTIMSIMGIKNNRSVMFGQNLLADNTVGKVFGQNNMSIGGFLTDELYGENGMTGLKVFNKFTNEELDSEQYMNLSEEAKKTLSQAHYILDTNQITVENVR